MDGERIKRYRFYHLSFQEFVASKDQLKDQFVDLAAMHTRFADSMWERFG